MPGLEPPVRFRVARLAGAFAKPSGSFQGLRRRAGAEAATAEAVKATAAWENGAFPGGTRPL